MKRCSVTTGKMILDLLDCSPLTVAALANETGLSNDTIRNRLKELKANGKVHISGYVNRVYVFERIYSAGPGKDMSIQDYKAFLAKNKVIVKPLCRKPQPKKCKFRREFFDDLMFQVVAGKAQS